METREHVTIVREIIKGRDSPIKRCDTRVEDIGEKKSAERQVSKDQPSDTEEWSRSKVGVLQ